MVTTTQTAIPGAAPSAAASLLTIRNVAKSFGRIDTPFTFLPIYASLEHIPRNLVEASHDLGASPFQTFWRVIFPLSIPGVLAGATFAFVLSLGDFLAPLLLGGASGIMISNIVVSLFGAAYNWPLGAAISLCMLVLVVGLLFLSEKLEKKWGFR
jgi:spermidine/putrescine transport system permease protein